MEITVASPTHLIINFHRKNPVSTHINRHGFNLQFQTPNFLSDLTQLRASIAVKPFFKNNKLSIQYYTGQLLYNIPLSGINNSALQLFCNRQFTFPSNFDYQYISDKIGVRRVANSLEQSLYLKNYYGEGNFRQNTDLCYFSRTQYRQGNNVAQLIQKYKTNKYFIPKVQLKAFISNTLNYTNKTEDTHYQRKFVNAVGWSLYKNCFDQKYFFTFNDSYLADLVFQSILLYSTFYKMNQFPVKCSLFGLFSLFRDIEKNQVLKAFNMGLNFQVELTRNWNLYAWFNFWDLQRNKCFVLGTSFFD